MSHPAFRRRVARSGLIAAIATTGTATAADPIEPIRLAYEAPPVCPTDAQFFEEIGRRTGRLRPATADEPARRFIVSITSDDTGSFGILQIVGTDGSLARREIAGRSCAEVASALTLVVALAIDPAAALVPRSALAAPGSGDAPPPHPEAPSPAAGSQEPGRDARPATAPPARASTARSTWSIGAALESTLGLVPAGALGGGAFVDVALDARGPLAPSFRVTALAEHAAPSFNGSIGAELTWWAGRVEACPLRLTLGAALRAHACGALDAGVFRSTGTGIDHADSTTNAWFAPGAGARLAWAIANGPFVELGAAATLPLRRYPFYYRAPASPPTDVYDLPAVAAALSFGAGYAFR